VGASGAPTAAEAVEQEEEARAAKVPKAPEVPSAQEIEMHKASGHIQYRSWCKHCAQGRAAANPSPPGARGTGGYYADD